MQSQFSDLQHSSGTELHIQPHLSSVTQGTSSEELPPGKIILIWVETINKFVFHIPDFQAFWSDRLSFYVFQLNFMRIWRRNRCEQRLISVRGFRQKTSAHSCFPGCTIHLWNVFRLLYNWTECCAATKHTLMLCPDMIGLKHLAAHSRLHCNQKQQFKANLVGPLLNLALIV